MCEALISFSAIPYQLDVGERRTSLMTHPNCTRWFEVLMFGLNSYMTFLKNSMVTLEAPDKCPENAYKSFSYLLLQIVL